MIIKFHSHSTIELRINTTTIYIDPYLDPFSAEQLPKADLILISHAGYDHCSIETIRTISNLTTIVLGTREAATLINGCASLKTGETRDFGDFKIKVLQAQPYNSKHATGTIFGFGILAEDKTIFYPSDTKYLPAMADIKPDIMIVAIGGTLVMTAKEAAQFVTTLMPKIAIPVHYGRLNGTIDDARYFKELVETKQETKVVILREDEEFEL